MIELSLSQYLKAALPNCCDACWNGYRSQVVTPIERRVANDFSSFFNVIM